MLLYLRHGDDRGNDIYRHDRPLNDHGKHRAGKEARRLIKKYGHPNRVFVSPFRRAQETLTAMALHFDRPVEVHQDPRIAQLLSSKQQQDPHISPETRAVIIVNEDEKAFRHRVATHVRDARAWAAISMVWGITHQAVIEEIAPHFDTEVPKSLNFLDHVIMLE
jgi:broad specificity phosphatase PhoE